MDLQLSLSFLSSFFNASLTSAYLNAVRKEQHNSAFSRKIYIAIKLSKVKGKNDKITKQATR